MSQALEKPGCGFTSSFLSLFIQMLSYFSFKFFSFYFFLTCFLNFLRKPRVDLFRKPHVGCDTKYYEEFEIIRRIPK